MGWTDGDPASIERSDQGYPALNFTTGIFGSTDGNRIDPGGNQSALIWLETNATLWMVSGTALLDSGNHGDVAILAPLAPEPEVAVFLAIGALAMMGRKRR